MTDKTFFFFFFYYLETLLYNLDKTYLFIFYDKRNIFAYKYSVV